MERNRLADLIPLPDVPADAFGGSVEGREKIVDEIVALVEGWLQSNADVEIESLAESFRTAFGRDDLATATLDEFWADNDDREAVKQWATVRLPPVARTLEGPLIIRLHPESFNYYIGNISVGWIGVGWLAEKIQIRCNLRQPKNLITLSDREVAGDQEDCRLR